MTHATHNKIAFLYMRILFIRENTSEHYIFPYVHWILLKLEFMLCKEYSLFYSSFSRFRELLLEFSAQEDNSDALLEALDPINAKPTFTEENFAQHKTFGLAASQLCSWVQGVIGLHSTLQTKVRPLQARAQSMKSSLADFSDKLKKEEGKVNPACDQIEWFISLYYISG